MTCHGFTQNRRLAALISVIGPVLASGPINAQLAPGDHAPNAQFDPIVVTGNRVNEESFGLPMSIDTVDADMLRRENLQVNLSETLQRVPGINVQNRQNYAQDLQISSRGFGARTTFGVRGIKLYADGIPASMPDGQGQVSNFSLASAERVEVLRGPFAVLYGNASGGVIQIFTEDGGPEEKISAGLAFGERQIRADAKVSGGSDRLIYVADESHFETQGFRTHAAAQRDVSNTKLKWHTDSGTRVTLVGNGLLLPGAQDPMGLSRAEYGSNPSSTTPCCAV